MKSMDAPYDAGRRGSAWVKVKPVHTLDLVVLAVEWGSGRREGWLSNIHLGARADEQSGGDGFVMLGKTFKGMTDEMLAWQTERFTELAVEPETIKDHYVVPVRPEQVVEIALDGIQRSTRYPGGIALRFARVVRYRDDKSPAEADTLAGRQGDVRVEPTGRAAALGRPRRRARAVHAAADLRRRGAARRRPTVWPSASGRSTTAPRRSPSPPSRPQATW